MDAFHITGIVSCALLSLSLFHMTVLPVPLDCAKWLAVDTVILPHRPHSPHLTETAHTFVLADGRMQANQEYPDASKDECTRNLHSRLEQQQPLALGRMLQGEEVVICVKRNITKRITDITDGTDGTDDRQLYCDELGACANPSDYSDYIVCPSQYTASSREKTKFGLPGAVLHCRYECNPRIVATLQPPLPPSPPCLSDNAPCNGAIKCCKSTSLCLDIGNFVNGVGRRCLSPDEIGDLEESL